MKLRHLVLLVLTATSANLWAASANTDASVNANVNPSTNVSTPANNNPAVDMNSSNGVSTSTDANMSGVVDDKDSKAHHKSHGAMNSNSNMKSGVTVGQDATTRN